jgi:hypothetical protein
MERSLPRWPSITARPRLDRLLMRVQQSSDRSSSVLGVRRFEPGPTRSAENDPLRPIEPSRIRRRLSSHSAVRQAAHTQGVVQLSVQESTDPRDQRRERRVSPSCSKCCCNVPKFAEKCFQTRHILCGYYRLQIGANVVDILLPLLLRFLERSNFARLTLIVFAGTSSRRATLAFSASGGAKVSAHLEITADQL